MNTGPRPMSIRDRLRLKPLEPYSPGFYRVEAARLRSLADRMRNFPAIARELHQQADQEERWARALES